MLLKMLSDKLMPTGIVAGTLMVVASYLNPTLTSFGKNFVVVKFEDPCLNNRCKLAVCNLITMELYKIA